MTTPAQLSANRANALRSTGPRTSAGKAASSANSLTHGLASPRVVLPNEDPAEYEAWLAAWLLDLDPNGPLEEFLAQRIAAAAWRLRRAERVESEIIQWLGSKTDPAANARQFRSVVRAFWQDCTVGDRALEKIGRYESRLARQFARDLDRLRSLQRSRRSSQTVFCAISAPSQAELPQSSTPEIGFARQKTENSTEPLTPPDPSPSLFVAPPAQQKARQKTENKNPELPAPDSEALSDNPETDACLRPAL